VAAAFEARLQAAAGAVEARLTAALDACGAADARLSAAMRHAVLGGGKRFRPFLVTECAGLFGVPVAASADAAAALECVHCYSLVHDDLPCMDDDTLRRGRPTVWAKFDEWTAVLAGDALLTLAFEIVAAPESHPDPAVRSALTLALARAAGPAGMVGGQAMDLAAEKRGEPAKPALDHVRRLQSLKTGALIRVACEMGAILGAADGAQRSALLTYGDQLGFAFQIADDLLDAEGSAAVVGKAVGKDQAAGKATLVSLMGIDAARAKLAAVERAAIDALSLFGVEAEALREAARFMSRRVS
jgi:farnesyl diphosphate synthase